MNNARKDVYEGIRDGKNRQAEPDHQLLRQLDERITTARQTLKDLRNARRELEQAQQEAVNAINQAFEEAIKEVMPGYMESLKASVEKAIAEATTRVNKRFDTLADIMMGEDKPGNETIIQLVRRWKTRRDT